MGQDITTRVAVLGQNPDGSLNVRMDGNPFAMQTAQPQGAAMTSPGGPFRGRIGSIEVNFATEADMLKAELAQRQGGATGTGTGGTMNWLGLAANAGSAINNLFTRSNLDKKISDYRRSLDRQQEARSRLDQLMTKYPDLVPILTEIFDQERKATETAQAALEDLMAANGIAIGVDVAKAAQDFLASNQAGAGSIFSGGSGALLAAGAGLGVGLLASRSNNNNR